MRRIVLLLVALAPVSAFGQAASGPAEIVDIFHQALAAGVDSVATAVLAPDLIVFEEGGAETSLDAYVNDHLPADMKVAESCERTILERTVKVEGDVAWVMSRTRTSGVVDGEDVDRLGTETMVLVLGDGGWMIHHIHWSSRPGE